MFVVVTGRVCVPTRCPPSCHNPLHWSLPGSSSRECRLRTLCLFLTDRWSAAADWPQSLPASRFPLSPEGCSLLNKKRKKCVPASSFGFERLYFSYENTSSSKIIIWKCCTHLWCPCGRSCCCAGRKLPPGSAGCSGASRSPSARRTTSAGP